MATRDATGGERVTPAERELVMGVGADDAPVASRSSMILNAVSRCRVISLSSVTYPRALTLLSLSGQNGGDETTCEGLPGDRIA